MKRNIFIIILWFIFIESSAQSYSVGIDYTSKFIGETVDLNIMFQKNKHTFSGGLAFYSNRQTESEYGISKKQLPLSPVHFTILRNEAFGQTFIERTGFQLEYKYHLREEKIVQPYLFIGNVFSNIGFNIRNYPTDESLIFPKMFTWDLFIGMGLKVKLWNNVFLNQSVSPGILYINHSPFNSFSLNPMYRIGLIFNPN